MGENTQSTKTIVVHKSIGDRVFKDRISKSMVSFHTNCVRENLHKSNSLQAMSANEAKIVTEGSLKARKNEEAKHFEEASSCKNRCLAILDVVISLFVVAPMVVGSWHGLWRLMDIYMDIFPEIYTGLCGVILHATFALLKFRFQNWESLCSSKWLRIALSRVYCWSFLTSCVSHWRGGWTLYPGMAKNSIVSITIFGICLLGLIVLKSTRNLLTVPYFIGTDSPGKTFYFHTRLRKASSEPFLYLLDCLFSVVVVGSLVVFVWRGAWDLLDVYLFPHDRAMSAWTSFVIGYGVAIVTFLLQGAAKRACSKLKGGKRLVVADLFLLLSFIATINVWRSIWSLLDIYFLPSSPELSNWITHGSCFVMLMLLNCANSVLVRGVYIDAEEEDGQCVVFPCYYLRLFFQKERLKKRQRKLEAIASEKMDLENLGGEPLLTVKPSSLPVIVKSSNHIINNEPTHIDQNTENNNGIV